MGEGVGNCPGAGSGGSGTIPDLGSGRPKLASRPFVAFLDLPLPPGEAGFAGARIAVSASPFAGYEVSSLSEDGTLKTRTRVARPGTLGRLTAALRPGPEGRIDPANAITIALPRGALASISPASMLAGGNLCAVQCDDGGFEVLQFERAEEIASGEFRLSRLLRAQGGTEDAMAAGASVGALFVLLDGAAASLGIEAAEVGRSIEFRVQPYGRSRDDASVVAQSHALGTRSVRPLSPVHLTARFAADGAVELGWVRRTRSGGDNWAAVEVPLGEEAERYRAVIDDGTGTTAVFETAEPRIAISASEQAARFGGLPAVFEVSVAQVSPVWGAGTPRRATFSRPS